MKEVELKFKIDDKDKFIKKLEMLGIHFGEEIKQNDTVYVKRLDDVRSLEGSIWVRIREMDEKIELNLKKQGKVKSESKEIEFGISDALQADDFLETLGLSKWVSVRKKRRYAKDKEFNICLDDVERLGTFVELELMVSDEEEIDEQELLKEEAKKLEIDLESRIDSHYDTMIYELGE